MSARPDRIPCINPQCRRTAPATKYPAGAQIICVKCFKLLPQADRDQHRKTRKLIRMLARRMKKSRDAVGDGALERSRRIRNRLIRRLNHHWDNTIIPFFETPGEPHGLTSFLEETGL